MDIWELLGIGPTTDIASIKSAYARQAKLYHPEEHPEEFKALQNAYKIAVWTAKNQKAAEAEPTADRLKMDAGAEPSDDSPKPEKAFDYSSIDSFGDRERFFRQFLLIAKNPYLKNNQMAWDYFLKQKEFAKLFSSTDFRMNFVRTMCGLSGWHRKTILYFEQYLTKFHTKENDSSGEKWETQLLCFRRKKLPRLRLPSFCRDRFLTRNGAAFHKQLRAKISSSLGREMDFEIRADLIKYMNLYLWYGELQEDYIEHLYRGWKLQQALLGALVVFICFFVTVSEINSIERKKARENQLSYLREFYGSEFDTRSEEEQDRIRREYNRDWRYAGEAIDDVMDRYKDW